MSTAAGVPLTTPVAASIDRNDGALIRRKASFAPVGEPAVGVNENGWPTTSAVEAGCPEITGAVPGSVAAPPPAGRVDALCGVAPSWQAPSASAASSTSARAGCNRVVRLTITPTSRTGPGLEEGMRKPHATGIPTRASRCISGSSAVFRRTKDRWLCVPASRRVCPRHNAIKTDSTNSRRPFRGPPGSRALHPLRSEERLFAGRRGQPAQTHPVHVPWALPWKPLTTTVNGECRNGRRRTASADPPCDRAADHSLDKRRRCSYKTGQVDSGAVDITLQVYGDSAPPQGTLAAQTSPETGSCRGRERHHRNFFGTG